MKKARTNNPRFFFAVMCQSSISIFILAICHTSDSFSKSVFTSLSSIMSFLSTCSCSQGYSFISYRFTNSICSIHHFSHLPFNSNIAWISEKINRSSKKISKKSRKKVDK